MVLVIMDICDSQNKVVIQHFLEALWLKWPLCFRFRFVNERRNTVFLSLRADIIPILLEPFSIFLSLLKVKFSSIYNFPQIDERIDGGDNLSLRVKLSNNSLDSFQIFICDEIALVH